MTTWFVCALAYLLVGYAYFKTWMWFAIRNDIRDFGEDLDEKLGPMDKWTYLEFMIATVLFWWLAAIIGINGWYQRRKAQDDDSMAM